MTESIVTKGIGILHEEGVFVFSKKATKYAMRNLHAHIRPLLPKTGYQAYNSVKMDDERRLGDHIVGRRSRPNIEDGLVSGHKKYTQPGDSVIIVGGGNGVTAVRASRIVGNGGEVVAFEGGIKSVEKMREVAKLNGVDNICTARHAIVGQERNVYGGSVENAEVISPTNLPECNVLEMDAEGSEIDILNELEIRPRAVIMELHPWLYSDPPRKPIELLEEMGYDIQYYSGHDGIEISQEEFDILLEKSRDESNDKRADIESDARWPVVAGGRLPR